MMLGTDRAHGVLVVASGCGIAAATDAGHLLICGDPLLADERVAYERWTPGASRSR